jgi:hypothetical protein
LARGGSGEGKEEVRSRFFKKKRRKKLLLCWAMGAEHPNTHGPANKSFCGAFFKKRLLFLYLKRSSP